MDTKGNQYWDMTDGQFKKRCDEDKAREKATRRKMKPSKTKRVPRVKGSRKGQTRRTR